MTVFAAQFVDKKFLRTRLVYQLVFEIPAEAIDKAVEILGNPKGEEVWAGIARLKESDGARASPELPEKPTLARPALSVRLDGERIRTRAVMLCKDERFQDWIGVSASLSSTEEDHERDAAVFLCQELRIMSRAELATNVEAQKKFLVLEARFRRDVAEET